MMNSPTVLDAEKKILDSRLKIEMKKVISILQCAVVILFIRPVLKRLVLTVALLRFQARNIFVSIVALVLQVLLEIVMILYLKLDRELVNHIIPRKKLSAGAQELQKHLKPMHSLSSTICGCGKTV